MGGPPTTNHQPRVTQMIYLPARRSFRRGAGRSTLNAAISFECACCRCVGHDRMIPPSITAACPCRQPPVPD